MPVIYIKMTRFHLSVSEDDDSSEITLAFWTVFYALTHHILTMAMYIYTRACTHPQSLLAIPTIWWPGSGLGGGVVLFSLRGSVGEEGLIWRQFYAWPSVLQNNRNATPRTVVSLWPFLLHVLKRAAGLPGNSQEICASRDFPEYRHPALLSCVKKNPLGLKSTGFSSTLSLKTKSAWQM